MRKPEHSTEPSIEEILASIRNIIADDGGASKSSTQAHKPEPVRRSTRDFEDALLEDEANLPSQRGGGAAVNEQQAANTADAGDDLLELTEDFMLEELSGDQPDSGSKSIAADQLPKDFYSNDSAEEFRPFPSPEEEELDEVLSNLAAEVERLAAPEAVQKGQSKTDTVAQQLVENKADEGHVPPAADDTKEFGTPEFAEPDDETVGQPQLAGMAEPKPAVPPVSPPFASYARQPATPAAKSKPVWSARRLEKSEKPAALAPEKATAASQEQPAPPEPPAAQSSKSPSVSRRDLWAEGVQMPVPDTGPEMPLPLSEDDSETVAKQDGTSQNEKPSAEADKRVVGSFLTRVFGSTSTAEPEDESAVETGLRAKAEKLARDTISDFAEEKLNAPAVGNALKADKDFMNEVASSLESALASSNEETDAESVSDGDLPDPASGEEPQPETQVGTVNEPGLDMKLKEALAADAQISDGEAAEQNQQDEDTFSAETAAAVVANIAQDETDEAALPETEETGQTATAGEETAEPVSEPAGDRQEEQADAVASHQPAPALNLPSSLEGGIKEMIKPLIIQWLNDNLPRIVEEAVREELTGRTDIAGQRDRSRA